MTQRIDGGQATGPGRPDSEALDLDAALVPAVDRLPSPETFPSMAEPVLQPWAIESEETVSDILRSVAAPELDRLDTMSTGQLAWSVAEFVVARQEEIVASGDVDATDGLAAMAELARMFEHLFIARGGSALDGGPA